MKYKLETERIMDRIYNNMMLCYPDNPEYIISVFKKYIQTENEKLFTRQNSIRDDVHYLGLETIKKEILKLPVKWMAYFQGEGKATRQHGNLDKMEFSDLTSPANVRDDFLYKSFCFLKSQRIEGIEYIVENNPAFLDRMAKEYFSLRYGKVHNIISADTLDFYYSSDYEAQMVIAKINSMYENEIKQPGISRR